jgi:hypothetical protein
MIFSLYSGGTALHISDSLETARSSPCDTFENPPLNANTDTPFQIGELLVYAFADNPNDPNPFDDEE